MPSKKHQRKLDELPKEHIPAEDRLNVNDITLTRRGMELLLKDRDLMDPARMSFEWSRDCVLAGFGKKHPKLVAFLPSETLVAATASLFWDCVERCVEEETPLEYTGLLAMRTCLRFKTGFDEVLVTMCSRERGSARAIRKCVLRAIINVKIAARSVTASVTPRDAPASDDPKATARRERAQRERAHRLAKQAEGGAAGARADAPWPADPEGVPRAPPRDEAEKRVRIAEAETHARALKEAEEARVVALEERSRAVAIGVAIARGE
jgi:hypothetical protein